MSELTTQVVHAQITENVVTLQEESLVYCTRDEYGDETKESQAQERLEDLERKLAQDLTITDNTANSSVSSSVVKSQATTTLPDADIQLQDALHLVACESQIINCQSNGGLNENENFKLREKVTDLEKKLTSMQSKYMAKKVTLESITRVKMCTEKPKHVEGREEKYKKLEANFINTKTFLEKQKSLLEGSVLRLEKDVKQTLATNVELTAELELSRKSVVVLTDKLAHTESIIKNESRRNDALERRINVTNSELEILSRQQQVLQHECELKVSEITKLNSQLESASQKLKETETKLSITEKQLAFQKNEAATHMHNDLEITKKLAKAEAALELMIEKYKVNENAVGQKSRLEKELQKTNNNYNLSLQKVKRLKIKLAKQSKTLRDLKFKWRGLTTYFRTLEEKSAKGELLSRSDFDTVLNYLMSSSFLNKDIKVELNGETTIDKFEKDLIDAKRTTSSTKDLSSRRESISKDAIEKVVKDFREVAITKKSDCGKVAELCITKEEEEEIIVVKRKPKQPDVITLDSGSDTHSCNSVVKKRSCGAKKSLTGSSKNKRPYSKSGVTYSQSSRPKKRTPLQYSQRDSNYRGRRSRSSSRSRTSRARRGWSSRSLSWHSSDSSCSEWSRCSSPYSKSLRLRCRESRQSKRSRSPSCDSYEKKPIYQKGRHSGSHSPIYRKRDRRLKSPIRKSYYRRRRSRSVSMVKISNSNGQKRSSKNSARSCRTPYESGKEKSCASGNYFSHKNSNSRDNRKLTNESRKEVLEAILLKRLENVEKEEGECSEVDTETVESGSNSNQILRGSCNAQGDSTNVLSSPLSSVDVDISESEWDNLLMSPQKESPLHELDQLMINQHAIGNPEGTSEKLKTVNHEKSLPAIEFHSSNKNGSYNHSQSACLRSSETETLPHPSSRERSIYSLQSEMAVCYRSLPSQSRQNSSISGSKMVRKKSRTRKAPFKRPPTSATIPLQINVDSGATLDQSNILDSLTQKYTISITKEIPGYNNKHPVDCLNDMCVAKGWPPPEYQYEAETNTIKRELHYFCDVLVNGVLYQPKVGSRLKKDAQTLSAAYCLQQLEKSSELHL